MGKNYLFHTIMCLYFPDHPSLTWYSHFQNFHHQHHGLPDFCIIQKSITSAFLYLVVVWIQSRPKQALETLWALTILFYTGSLFFCHSMLACLVCCSITKSSCFPSPLSHIPPHRSCQSYIFPALLFSTH